MSENNIKHPVMTCKLVLHNKVAHENSEQGMHGLRFGAVWEAPKPEGTPLSENAIFGRYTPHAEFNASVCNQNVLEQLQPGKAYIVTFTEAENQ